jgi:amino acid efflux transporter
LYVGAVVGPGVLALPALAAATAGPASIIAWGLLLALSVPVAATFAALGSRYPDGGGSSVYVAHAFGNNAAAIVGWWFYAVVPIAVLSGAMIGGEYVAAALGAGQPTAMATSLLILAAAFGANSVGLRLSGGMQLVMVAVLTLLLCVVMATSAPYVSASSFTPFAPQGSAAVLSAVALLFYAFAGWEAASHLSGEFARPRRDLAIATVSALCVVTVLYLGLAVVTVGALDDPASVGAVPLLTLAQQGMGQAAVPVVAATAVCLTFGAVNTFVAGAARLGAALGRDGALPSWFARGGAAGEVPRRSLLVQFTVVAACWITVVVTNAGLEPLMRITAVFLAAVTAAAMAAAVVLASGWGPMRMAALVSAVFTGVVMLSSGPLVLLPVGIAAAAFFARRWLVQGKPARAVDTDSEPGLDVR